MIAFSNVMDALTINWLFLINLTYLVFVMYKFGRLMEEKQQRLAHSCLPFLIIVMSVVFIGLYLGVQAVCAMESTKRDRSYPLFKPAPKLIVGPLEEDDPAMEQLDKIWAKHNRGWFGMIKAMFSHCRFDGFYAFLNYVYNPVMNWTVKPFCRFTGLSYIYNATLGKLVSGLCSLAVGSY